MEPTLINHIIIRLALAIPVSLATTIPLYESRLLDMPFWKWYLYVYICANVGGILFMPLFVDL